MKKLLVLALFIIGSYTFAQTNPIITGWLQNNTIFGRYYSAATGATPNTMSLPFCCSDSNQIREPSFEPSSQTIMEMSIDEFRNCSIESIKLGKFSNSLKIGITTASFIGLENLFLLPFPRFLKTFLKRNFRFPL